MSNAMPPTAPELAVFGQPAILTPPSGDEVELTVVVTNRPGPPAVGSLGSIDLGLRPFVAIPRADLEDVTTEAELRGWVIETAIEGRDRTWTIDRVDAVDPAYWRVQVS